MEVGGDGGMWWRWVMEVGGEGGWKLPSYTHTHILILIYSFSYTDSHILILIYPYCLKVYNCL